MCFLNSVEKCMDGLHNGGLDQGPLWRVIAGPPLGLIKAQLEVERQRVLHHGIHHNGPLVCGECAFVGLQPLAEDAIDIYRGELGHSHKPLGVRVYGLSKSQ